MAKRAQVDNLFAKTDPQSKAASGEDKSPVQTQGLGLRANEWAELEEIGAAFDLSRHAMTAYAVRYFLKLYRAGEIPTPSKPTLPGL
jgi:hypothetical protein